MQILNDNRVVAAIIIVIVIIVIFLYFRGDPSLHIRALNGLWIAGPEFCESAEIGSMTLLINDGDGHIVVVDEDGEISVDDNFTINVTHPWTASSKLDTTAKIVGIPDFPESVIIELDLAKNILVMSDDTDVWAVLHKDGRI